MSTGAMHLIDVDTQRNNSYRILKLLNFPTDLILNYIAILVRAPRDGIVKLHAQIG